MRENFAEEEEDWLQERLIKTRFDPFDVGKNYLRTGTGFNLSSNSTIRRK